MQRKIRAVLTKEHLAEVVAAYMEFDEFAFDTETKGANPGDALNPLLNEVTWISLAGPGRADAIPVAHVNGEVLVPRHVEKYNEPDPKKPGEIYATGPRKGQQRTVVRTRTIEATYTPAPKQLSPGYVFEQLEPLFFSGKRIVGHNLKFDLKTIAKYYDWWIPPGPYGETTSLYHLLNENRLQYRLGYLAEIILGAKYPKIGADTPHLHPFDDAAAYAMRDAKYTWMLWRLGQPPIKEQGLSGVLRLEMDLLPVLVDMEREGVIIDQEAMTELRKALEQQAYDIKYQILRDIRHVEDKKNTFNIAANADKAWYIYNHRGHEPEFFTKKTGQPSTAAKHLERFAKKDEMVALMLEHAKVEKVLGTYVIGMEPLLLADGRLHADFVAHGTVTGRMSCRAPNLQNIPRVDDEDESDRGLLIRRLFVSPEGYSFVAADYDQIEMRVLAHFSRDPTLVRIFEEDLDPHAATAAQVLGIDLSEVTKNSRQAAKAQPYDAKVLTPWGWRNMGDLKVGDYVTGSDGNATKVVGVYEQGVKPSYKVTMQDGASTECSLDHLWHSTRRSSEPVVRTLQQMIDAGLRDRWGKENTFKIPVVLPVKYAAPEESLPMDPYVLGLLLGDGGLRGPGIRFTSADGELIEAMRAQLPEGLYLDYISQYDYRITSRLVGGGGKNPWICTLRSLGLYGSGSYDKHVPKQYLLASPADRLALLQGLMDTDGSAEQKGGTGVFGSSSSLLITAVHQLAMSLGATATVTGGKVPLNSTHPAWKVSMRLPTGMNPFRLERKVEIYNRVKSVRRAVTRSIQTAEYVADKPMRCIAVDADDHLYVTDDFIVTHNTTNFLIMYGGGAKRLNEQTKMGLRKAEAFLETYWKQFPKVKQFADQVVRDARKNRVPFVTTDLNRRRRLPELRSISDYDRSRAERQAVNAKIQGTAADIIKIAMVEHARLTAGTKHKLVLSVHDELIGISPDDQIEEGKAIMEEAMLGKSGDGRDFLDVPLKAKATAAKRWADAK